MIWLGKIETMRFQAYMFGIGTFIMGLALSSKFWECFGKFINCPLNEACSEHILFGVGLVISLVFALMLNGFKRR